MAKRLLTADQVKEHLNITDFRHLTRDKLIEFVSAIPDMDKDIAIKAIEQFPEFSGYAKAMVTHYETLCDSVFKESSKSVESAMDGYKKTLDVLGELTKSDNINPDEKRFFAEKMAEVADKMATVDSKNKYFLAGMVKYITLFAGGTLIICAAVLGVKIRGAKIPHLNLT